MTNFRIEKSLPLYGPPAISFPDPSAFREGFVVSFATADGEWWTGKFTRGFVALSTVRNELGPGATIVVSGGQAYLVDVDRRLASQVTVPVEHIEYSPSQHLIILGNGLWFDGFGASGNIWRTRRISWDGMRSVECEGGRISGEAFTPMGPPDWHPFVLDLGSGLVEGGSYNGPP